MIPALVSAVLLQYRWKAPGHCSWKFKLYAAQLRSLLHASSPLAHVLTRSLACSLTHPVNCSLQPSLLLSQLLARSLACSLTHSPTPPFTHPPSHPPTLPPTHPPTHPRRSRMLLYLCVSALCMAKRGAAYIQQQNVPQKLIEGLETAH